MEIDLNKLRNIQGKELKYSKLCEALGLESLSHNSKKAQLDSIGLYCDLKVLSDPTRYVVMNVISTESAEIVEELNKSERTNLLFEVALYKEFLNTNCHPLYLSKAELLLMLKEINKNLFYSRNSKIMKKLAPELPYMAELSEQVYSILYKWTLRQLKRLHKREILFLREGYRLYKIKTHKYGNYLVKYDVLMNSELEQECLKIRAEAIDEVIPDCLLQDATSRANKGQFTLKEHTDINELASKKVKERFGGKYDFMARIYIITPPTKEAVEKRLDSAYGRLDVLGEINKTAIDKIMTTKQLCTTKSHKGYSKLHKRMFVDINMIEEPLIVWDDKLREYIDKQIERGAADPASEFQEETGTRKLR